jgi:hypothetical protein
LLSHENENRWVLPLSFAGIARLRLRLE